MDALDIQSIAIHPAIGIARVGNAPEDWFLATDLVGGVPEDKDSFRDAEGRIKRQAARFRAYATLRSGDVRELTLDDVDEIGWRVEIANLKAGWYKFNYPMDLPVVGVTAPERRNADLTGAARAQLDIVPGAKAISGRDVGGPDFHFDDGVFFGKPVYLGELRTDSAGRLLFFGGRGDSAPEVAGTPPTTFANNERWHDDVADGPIRASVRIGDRSFEATPAHVVVAPPNYGPGLFGIVTMDDVVQDLFIREGWITPPRATSFTRDIWPIFDRMTGHQWVNDGFVPILGAGSPLDARSAEVIDKLRDGSAAGAAYRQSVTALFRRPGESRPGALPPTYGDALLDRRINGQLLDPTRQELFLTDLQYAHLGVWVAGTFEDDWQGVPTLPDFDALTGAEQVEQLDRAGLHECLGGPFHPGIEITWPFRRASMWAAPYRLRSLPEGMAVRQDYGDVLSVQEALSDDGPHGASGAGSLTRWLGVPWQTDEASCNSGLLYSPSLYLSTPSFWGARVPNQVLSTEAYQLARNLSLPEAARRQHFLKRALWLRDINARGYADRITRMVSEWWQLGLVEAQSPPPGSDLPDPCFVETGRSSGPATDPTLELLLSVLMLEPEVPAAPLAIGGAAETAEETAAAAKNPRDYTIYGRGEV